MVKYCINKKDDFYESLKLEVGTFVKNNPSIRRQLIAKAICFILLESYSYYLFVSSTGTEIYLYALCLGVSQVFLAINLGHDGLHGSLSKNRLINKVAGYTFVLVGISPYLWKITHNLSHHHNPNISGHDFDIGVEGIQLIRWTKGVPIREYNKYQHLYAPILYSLASIWWLIIKDFKLIRNTNITSIRLPKDRKREMTVLVSQKICHLLIFVVVPLLVNKDLILVLGAFLLMHLVQSFIMSHIFLVAHLVEGTLFIQPESNLISTSWSAHQILTTCNFSSENRVASALYGGLNHQIEHHLFPHIPHVYYYHISKIVKAKIATTDLTYLEHPNVLMGIYSHYRLLKKLGQK